MRLAEPTDCARLEYLENVLFPDNSFNEYTLVNELLLGRCWVVERRGKIVAYLLARIDGELIDIMRVGVLPEFQEKGIGTQMLHAALTQAPEAMLCVRKKNKRALKLYRRLGFTIVGETPNRDLPSWVMRTTSRGRRNDAHSGTA